MTRYAESSAVLAWLFDEVIGAAVAEAIGATQAVVTSELTILECERALRHRVAIGEIDELTARALRVRLTEASQAWNVEPIGPLVLQRASQSFPDDAVRALDAIHLATAVVIRASIGPLDILSLDERVRSNALALGFRVLPD